MTKSIWITRARPNADQSAIAWQAVGITPIIAPLLDLCPAPLRPEPPAQDAALIFTSKNGVFAHRDYGFVPKQLVYAVGDATARAARELGFEHVMSAGGTWEDVIKLVSNTLSKNVPLIHCAGKHVRGRISEGLRAVGYDIRRDLYYQSQPVTVWPDIDVNDARYIAFYSPLAARTFCELLSMRSPNSALSLDIHKVEFISISEAVNAVLNNLGAKAKHVAHAPNEMAMLDVLARYD